MPYTEDEFRKRELSVGAVALDPGELTYQIQQCIQRYLSQRIRYTGRLRYSGMSNVLGSLEGAKADFIERVLRPYEATKQKENGDVWVLPGGLPENPTEET